MAVMDRKQQIDALKIDGSAGFGGEYIVIDSPESLAHAITVDTTERTNIRNVTIINKTVQGTEISGLEFLVDPESPLFPKFVEAFFEEKIIRVPIVTCWVDENNELIPSAVKCKMAEIALVNSGDAGTDPLTVTIDISPTGALIPIDDVEYNGITPIRMYETLTVTVV